MGALPQQALAACNFATANFLFWYIYGCRHCLLLQLTLSSRTLKGQTSCTRTDWKKWVDGGVEVEFEWDMNGVWVGLDLQ